MFAITRPSVLTLYHKVGTTCRKYKIKSYQLSRQAENVNCSHQTDSDWGGNPRRMELATNRVPVTTEHCPLNNTA